MNDLTIIEEKKHLLSQLPSTPNELAAAMLPLPQPYAPVTHRFGPGVYIREMFMPKDSLIVGAYHKHPHVTILLKGKALYRTPDGQFIIATAPLTLITPPGQKIGFILEDSILQNIYATNERDISKLDKMLYDECDVLLEYTAGRIAEQSNFKDSDRKDFTKMLAEVNMTEEQATELSNDMRDHVDLPIGNYSFAVGPSSIAGEGVFATKHFKAGEVIGPARIGGCRTILGRKVNHSCNPNSRCVRQGNDLVMFATRIIVGQHGGNLGDEITTNYRETFAQARLLDKDQ